MRQVRTTGIRWDRRLVMAFVVIAFGGLSTGPVSAQGARPTAATNGFARASAAFVPFAANPNFDFWPVYSMSESDNGLSHGVSAGLWPGFLVDATFFQFGYQPFERAVLGVAESLYPNQPEEDFAGSADFAKMCAAGEVTRLQLPSDLGDGGAPEPLLTGCQSTYNQYREFIPYDLSSARTSSAHLKGSGLAKGASLNLGPVSIGSARVTSSTDATDNREVVSISTVLLSDVSIGTSLRIAAIRSSVRTVADGTKAGTTATRSLKIDDATVLNTPVKITDEGIQAPTGSPAVEALEKEGIQVRLIKGGSRVSRNDASAESGGLVVRMTRGAQKQFSFENDDTQTEGERGCAALADAQPDPVANFDRDLGENPLFGEAPPYNQTPRRVRVEESVPPLIPCPLLLFDRAVDVGLVLGGASASSRYLELPKYSARPGLGGGDFGVPDDGYTGGFDGGPSDDPETVLPDGSELPGYGQTPPVPIDRIIGAITSPFGADVAGRVRAIYAGMALLLGMALVGRRVFMGLIHE